MIELTQLAKLAFINTLGLSILIETLTTASKFIYLKSTARTTETYACYMYVQGTGLDTLLKTYHLNYDADEIRDKFNYYLDRKKKYGWANYMPSAKREYI